MADYSVEIFLEDHKRGDKWVGIPSIGPVIINGSQPDSTLARIRMMFKLSGKTFTLDSENSDIDISNGTTWEASIPEVQKFLEDAGKWAWDMEFYDADDISPVTLYKGVITVHNGIS